MEIRILLVDDHRIFREGIRKLLEQQKDFKIIGEANDGWTALEMLRKLKPNAVLMDVTMPNLNGIDATRRILEEQPEVKVIVLSMHGSKHLVRSMLEAGASGYLLKECSIDELTYAIRKAVTRNQIYMSPEITRIVVDQYLNQPETAEALQGSLLTPTEREVLQQIAEGRTNKEIAEIMNMSIRTVEKYRPKIMKKVKADNLAELIKYAIQEGLTSSS